MKIRGGMFKFAATAVFMLVMLSVPGCEKYDNVLPISPSSVLTSNKGNTVNPVDEAKEVAGNILGVTSASASATALSIPKVVNGFELTAIQGWLANLYPWDYFPHESTVHPVSRLWTPYQRPTPSQVMEQCKQIREFGGGAAILEYNPNPSHHDHNYWLSNDFANGCGPFFLLYEHIFGTRYTSSNGGPKNMSDLYNRKVFKEDIRFIWENVIWDSTHNTERYPGRYVTVNGRAVIYMWSSGQIVGDFASLLEEVKKDYPVFFVGSEGMRAFPERDDDKNRVKSLDGFMEYSLADDSKSYVARVHEYARGSYRWRRYLDRLSETTGKRYLIIPTFQAAYDDSKTSRAFVTKMYARERGEVELHAELIRDGMRRRIYDSGPLVVYGELPEGAAVIESQCLLETMDGPGRFVGCGLARLEILREFFGGLQ